jgi:Rieske Fe-S protein
MSDRQDLSRRTLLGAAAAGIASLPLLADAAVPKGGAKGGASTERTPTSEPAPRPGMAGGAGGPGGPPARVTGIPSTKSADGWIVTKKAADIADKSFVAVADQPFVLSRKGDEIFALSTKCTHRGCAVKPQGDGTSPAGKDAELACPCHKAQFSLTGAVTKPPATKPLARYKLRLNPQGIVEVDTAAVDGQGPDTVVTIKA